MKILIKHKQLQPSDVLKGVQNKTLNFDDYNKKLGSLTRKLGHEQGSLSNTKKARKKKC